jgi:hypothetical protein
VFATCSYRQFQPWMGVPVRTSLGKPRHPLLYELRHSMPEVMPGGGMLRLDYDDFRRRYRHKLHRTTSRRILAAADRIRAEAGVGADVPLVLLCFEHLADPGTWCHRSIFAHWLEQQTGLEVHEFGDLLVAQPVPQAAELLAREKKRVTRHFQRYSPEERARHAASHRLGPRQKTSAGSYFFTHPELPGRAYASRGEAARAAVDAAVTGLGTAGVDPTTFR